MKLKRKINISKKVKQVIRFFTKTRRRKILSSILAVLTLITSLRFLIFKPKQVMAAQVELSTTSTTVQIDVANRYRAIMNTEDTNDYITIYDRYKNNSSPIATHEFHGPCILESSTIYCLRDDGNRKTTILESSPVRVKVRVEGMFANESSTGYLQDSGTDDNLDVSVEYTFTTEGIYISNMTDFKDGLTLDSDSSHNGYEWLGVWADVTDSAYNDSGNITYGDGQTEGTTSADGDIANSNKYVMLDNNPGYQDVLIGVMYAGWLDDHTTSAVNEWNWDEGNDGTQDLLAAQDQNGSIPTSGIQHANWFMLMLPSSRLNSAAERKSLINDYRNPDIPTYNTGSELDNITSHGGNESGKLVPSAASPGLYFTGTGDWVDMNDGTLNTLDFTDSDDFTIELWFKRDDTTNEDTLIAKRNSQGPGAPGYIIWIDSANDDINFEVEDDGSSQYLVNGISTITDSNWHHVAAVFDQSDDTSCEVYLDGALDTETTDGSSALSAVGDISNAVDFRIGSESDGGEQFNGMIDEVRVWDDVRSTTEIQENMYKHVDPSSESSLVGYWRLNENTGSSTFDETTNNNDGTITNALWETGFVPDQYNEAESAYTIDADGSQVSIDLDAGSDASTLANGAITAGSTSITVDSTTGFDSSGVAYINSDKFTYTGKTSTTFTGIPSSGENSVVGHADNSIVAVMNRHDPAYKIRKYRQNNEPTFVTQEGKTLTQTYDYNASIKPISDAYFADELTLYSTMDSETAVENPDIGTGDSSGYHEGEFPTGKYGKGFETIYPDSDQGYVYFPMSGNMDSQTGTIEFWYKETGVADYYETFLDSTEGTEQFNLYRNNSDTSIGIEINNQSAQTWDDITNVFDGNWHHLRLTYDTVANSIFLYIDGESQGEITYDYNDIDIGSYNLIVGNGSDDGGTSYYYAVEGIIDEFKIYNTVLGPDTIAKGGNNSDSDEYLADETNDYTLGFEADDSYNRGEYLFLGSDDMFSGVNFEFNTVGTTSDADLNWQYWDGDSWANLESITGFTDGTSNLTQGGVVYWNVNPTNWRPYSMNGSTDLYYIRAHLESGSYSVSPIENRIRTDILLLQYYNNLESSDQTLITPTTPDSPTPVIAWWKFDEGYGTVAHDAMGYNYGESDAAFGPDIDAPTWTEEDRCLSGKCLEFDGANDYLTATSSSILDSIEGYEVSFSAWIRHGPQSSGQDVILSKYETSEADGGYKLLMESDGDITFGIDNDNSGFPKDKATSTAATYDDNAWHHVVGVKDSTSVKLYIDGQLVNTDNSLSLNGSLENNDTFYIGIDGNGESNPFDGFIDEVKVYTFALDEDQVKADYLGGKRGLSAKMGGGDLDWLSHGLVGYWNMDDGVESEGETVTDKSGNSNNGTLYGDNGVGDNGSGMTATASGRFGTAAEFDGTDDYIDIPNPASSTKGTLAAWVYPDDASPSFQEFFIDAGAAPNRIYFLRYNTSGNLSVRYGSMPADVDTGVNVPEHTWSHVATSWNSGNYYVYLNGSQIASGTYPGSTIADVTATIGSFNSGTSLFFDGTIDEARIYNRALSPAEVEKLYRWAPGPVAHWKFDEGTGTSANDSSGNSNTGTLSSLPSNPWVNGKYGKALEFEGTNDVVNAGSDSSLDNLPAMTISAWVFPECGTDYGQIVAKSENGTPTNGWFFQTICSSTDSFSFWVDYDSTDLERTSATSTLTRNQWQYVSLTWDGSSTATNAHIYVNGVEVPSYSDTTNGSTTRQTDATQNLTIGNSSDLADDFDGYLDDIRVYNYIRTQEQIVSDMNAGHPAPGSPVGSPIGYWKFDEGYGDTAYDSSPQGNNGDLAGSGTTCSQTSTAGCPAWSNSGKFGKAADFDASGDYTQLSQRDGLDATDFTLSLWIKPDNVSDDSAIVWNAKSVSPNCGWSFAMDREVGACDNGDICMFLSENCSSNSSEFIDYTYDFPTTSWSHFTSTFNNNTKEIVFYINGNKVHSETATKSVAFDDGVYTRIGMGTSSPVSYDGKIDEVKIYNFALTPDQVKAEYNQGFAAGFGSLSTDSSLNPSNSSLDSYCPPGQGSACVGPVAEWKFDEASGSTAYDTSGNNLPLTLDSSSSFGNGVFGNSLLSDGVNNNCGAYRTDGSSSPLDLVGALSISFRLKANRLPTSDSYMLVTKGNTGTDAQNNYACWLHEYGTGPYINCYVGNISSYSSVSTLNEFSLSADTWYHVEFTHSATGGRYLYVNGILVDSNATVFTPTANNNNFTVAGVAFDFPGYIDDLKVYNYARTPAQIAWDYNRGKPVGWWKFDEGAGTSTSTVYDASGNKNNGTISLWGGGNTATSSARIAGKINDAIDLDGEDDYINIPDDVTLRPEDGSLTISLWANPANSDQNNPLIAKRYNGSGYEQYNLLICGSLGCGSSGQQLSAIYMQSDDATDRESLSVNDVADGNWHHYVMVADKTADEIFLYLDGVKLSTTTNSNGTWPTINNADSLQIGGENGSKFFNNSIDDFRIYNYTLTLQQIKDIYNQGAVRFGP